MVVGIIIAVVVVLLILFVIVTYNGLVRTRNRIDNAFSQIDVQLKRRHDLIPNLVETVKGYAAHEKGVFESVTQARANAINAQSASPRDPGPGREPADRCAEEPVRGGRGLPRPQGQPELPEPAGGAHLDRGQDRLLAAVLQRLRAGLQQPDPVVPGATSSPAWATSRRASTSRATPASRVRSRSSSDRPARPVLALEEHLPAHGHVRADRAQQATHLRDARGLRAADRGGRGRARLLLQGRRGDRADRDRHRDRDGVDVVLRLRPDRAGREPGQAGRRSRVRRATTTSSRACASPPGCPSRGCTSSTTRAERVRHRPQPEARRASRSRPACSRR